jgi:hypothetical protein
VPTTGTDTCNVASVTESSHSQEDLDRMVAQQEPGVAQAITTYEAVERAYFQAVAATPSAVMAISYAATTSRR